MKTEICKLLVVTSIAAIWLFVVCTKCDQLRAENKQLRAELAEASNNVAQASVYQHSNRVVAIPYDVLFQAASVAITNSTLRPIHTGLPEQCTLLWSNKLGWSIGTSANELLFIRKDF